jgi:hypothetical protein
MQRRTILDAFDLSGNSYGDLAAAMAEAVIWKRVVGIEVIVSVRPGLWGQ